MTVLLAISPFCSPPTPSDTASNLKSGLSGCSNIIYESSFIEKVIEYDNKKIADLMNDKGIIRNRRKITASINNSKIFKEIQNEYGSFDNYIWHFTDNKIVYEKYETIKNDLSDLISKDLYKRGMRFVGTLIIYSYLQAIGIISSHSKNCFKGSIR